MQPDDAVRLAFRLLVHFIEDEDADLSINYDKGHESYEGSFEIQPNGKSLICIRPDPDNVLMLIALAHEAGHLESYLSCPEKTQHYLDLVCPTLDWRTLEYTDKLLIFQEEEQAWENAEWRLRSYQLPFSISFWNYFNEFKTYCLFGYKISLDLGRYGD